MQLAGDLSEFSLTDIIQLVDLSKKTGGVFIQGRRGQEEMEGWLYFRDGKIIGARLGDLPPLEFAYTFFTFSSGPFRFQDDAQGEQTITQSNEMIIMEGIMRQDAWAKLQEQVPSMNIVPRLVPNPAATGMEINLEAEEWRVLTMINGSNTIGQIAQRSGLGELKTGEIIGRLFASGLIEKREISLVKSLFPELEKIAINALGSSVQGLLEELYMRVGIYSRASATREQVMTALETFETIATRVFGAERLRKPLSDMRACAQKIFSSM